jgi:acyl transferase domain-containing protein/short-subunit dehydrogenase
MKEGPPRVAVVGMACRFPGAADLESFWTNLRDGVESFTRFSDQALEAAGVPRSMLTDPRCVKVAPSLGSVDRFDAAFFGCSAREAERLDPQQRLLLECAHEALEHAGCVPERFRGRIGVYVGTGANGYLEPLIRGVNVVAELESVLGNDKDYAATRLSYKLNLRGPSVTVQTACSTSLVAIHMASQALLAGECDLALAGGAKVRLPQEAAYIYQEGGILSPDGRCRAFDAGANGTTFGSGAGVVALKRLDDAIEAGDLIDAVILGSAVNNDGAAKVGYVAPSEAGQAEVIAEALAVADVDAATITYVEAHGTGTPLGDPIEVAALTRAFRERARGAADCAIGSVKTNIGHLETAAGVAGFIKTVLALKHRCLPASLNFRRPNPHIDFARTPFHVNAERTEWMPHGDRLRAGVSSFGIGGTNAHVVLEEAPPRPPRARTAARVLVMPVSARSAEALRDRAERLAAELTAHRSDRDWLEDACATAAVRRSHFEHRACAVGDSADALVAALQARCSDPGPAINGRARLAFVYSGQGSQWIGMGRRLLCEDAAFAKRLRECDEALGAHAGFSVRAVLEADGDPRWTRVDVIQPLIFAMQVSLSAAWSARGVEPDAVIGHSLGEVAASVVAGSLSLEDGAYVIATRSRMVSRTCGQGRMALVELSIDEAERALSGRPDVSVASHHGPRTVLISGASAPVETLVRSFETQGIFARLVGVDYASHSAQMDAILDELRVAMAPIRSRRGKRARQCSTVLADVVQGEELGGEYWVRNLREPVRFHESVEKLVELGHTVFVEVSPHPVLSPTIERTLGERGAAFGTLRREGDDVLELAGSLAKLYEHGVDIDWPQAAPGGFVRLPAYPWQRQRYWAADALRRTDSTPAIRHPWLRSAVPHAAEPDTTIWQGTLGVDSTPELGDHRVQDVAVVAGAVWLEAALRAARERGAACALEDVEFADVLALGDAESANVQVIAGPPWFEVWSAPAGQKTWTRHARGKFSVAAPRATSVLNAIRDARERCAREMAGATLYGRLVARGIRHGPRYACVRRVWGGNGEAVGELALDHAESGTWVVEPWWIDACIQVLGAAEEADDPRTYLPVRIGRLTLHDRPRTVTVRVHARWRRVGDDLHADVTAHDEGGAPWLEATGIVLRPVGRRRHPVEGSLLRLAWEGQPLLSDGPPQLGPWLVLSDGPIGDALIERLRAAGARVERIRRADADFDRALEAVPECAGIVFLFPAESAEPASTIDIERAQANGVLSVLALVQSLARASLRDAPRLWLVTRGAVTVPGDPAARVTHAPVWGLGRTIAHEHPGFRCTCVDLRSEADVDALISELLASTPEEQIALRSGGRSVARLVRTDLDEAPAFVRAANGRPFGLEIDRPGHLDTLALREVARRPPGPGEVEIEVEAAGVNLLDVLIALGALRDDAPGSAANRARIGVECSGRVSRLGPGVEGLNVGDRVAAIAHEAFRSFVVARVGLTVKVPAHVSLEQAAGFPIAFVTAHLALCRVARLETGERVLIHAASSGVGRAAVQLAQRIGAEVFATAGNDAKRERLRRAGVQHVMSSRSLDFVREIERATAGAGVDVVLNSLAGEFIDASFGLLREHGRFVEIGKRDYYADRKLSTAPFLRNLTFSLFDLRGTLYTRPQIIEEALRDLAGALSAGLLDPLSVDAFPVARAAEAFRTMAEARHSEKIVLTMGASDAQIAPRRSDDGAPEERAYLITGGLGALGLELASHLVRNRGVRRLVLMGRRQPSAQAEAEVRTLVDAGATVSVELGDVADPRDVARVVDAAAPLAAVVHAAGVLDDGILLKQDARRFATVMAPKVAGAWNLHLATKDLDLDAFVLLSSTASLLGAPGQGNYAAASAFLDAVAHHRRALGLPAVSIQFGPWSDIGLAAEDPERGRRRAAQGMPSLAPSDGLAAFDLLSSSGFVDVGVVSLDLRQWLDSHPHLIGSPLLRRLVDERNAVRSPRSGIREALFAAPEEDRRSMLERHLRGEAARVLRMSPEAIDPSTSLIHVGMTSLTALEYRNRLELSLGATLPATLFWSHPTTAALTEQIAARLGCAIAGRAPIADAPLPGESALAHTIDQLSDEDAERALLAALEGMEAES